MPKPYCFDYSYFVIQCEIRKYNSSFVLLSQDWFGYFRSNINFLCIWYIQTLMSGNYFRSTSQRKLCPEAVTFQPWSHIWLIDMTGPPSTRFQHLKHQYISSRSLNFWVSGVSQKKRDDLVSLGPHFLRSIRSRIGCR